jgi:signal transduction histidine kinase
MTPGSPAADVRPFSSGGLMSRVPVVVATVLAGCTWATAAGIEPFAMLDSPTAISLAGVVASLVAVLTCWAGPPWREPVSVGAAEVVAAWLAGSLQGLQGLPDSAIAAALASPVLALAGFVVLLRPARRWSVTVGLLTVLAFGLHLAGYQPLLDPGCLTPCADLSAPLAELLGAREALAVTLIPELCAAVLVVGLAFRGPDRVLMRASAATGAVGFAVADVVPWWRWGEFTSTMVPDRLRTFAVMQLTAVVVVVAAQQWQARRALALLAQQLDTASGIRLRGVQDLHFAVPGSPRWVDANGGEVTADRELPAVVLTGHDGEPAVRLVAAPRVRLDLAAALPPALRLALDNARLAVVGRARLADLRASQARIVAIADTERQRIERDLHDGAQQQLVGAAMHLSAVRSQLTDTGAEAVGQIQALVHDALAGLRDISHGALLRVLGSEGLSAAVEDLVATTNLHVELEVGDIPRLGAPVERAAYDVVAAGLAAAEQAEVAAQVAVRLSELGDSVAVTVTIASDAAATNRFADAADRVSATGGTFIIDNDDALTIRLQGVWPCAS